MSNGKTFILCIGAQKAGTTWLEAQFSKTNFFSNDGIKEYHIFNKLAASSPQQCKRARKQIKINPTKVKIDLINKRTAMRLRPELYFEHFDYIYCRDNNVTHVGDITPDYSILPKRVFRYIKKGLEDKQFEIKVVFLMRDPVERAWSHPRMINRIKNERGKASKVSSEDEFKQLKDFYKSRLCVSRTQYERTCSRIESIFPKKNIFYGFYETLFNQVEINRLTDFLEAPQLSPDFGEIVHASYKHSTTHEGTDELLKEIKLYYDSTYRWFSNRHSSTIPIQWKQV